VRSILKLENATLYHIEIHERTSMRILIATHYFHPSFGGIETVCAILAEGLAARGHAVTVATMTPASPGTDDRFPFQVVRRPSFATQRRLAHDADVVWENGISLHFAGLLATSRPCIFAHHALLRFAVLKRLVCITGRNVFVSEFIRDAMRLLGPVIPNSYDQATFRIHTDVVRDRDVAFLGRLVPEKGADIFIDSLTLLTRKNLRLNATVIGSGPEEVSLNSRASIAGVSNHVNFSGLMRGEALARELNRHRILVVPSRCEEAFGLVALEGLACGCVVVGAQSGGLPAVIGPCGPTVPKNDPAALANALELLITQPKVLAQYREKIPAHLAKFTRDSMIDACEAVLFEAIAERRLQFRFRPS
jgi:glycogen(starch) synthase